MWKPLKGGKSKEIDFSPGESKKEYSPAVTLILPQRECVRLLNYRTRWW